ncbi:MAG: hypothetical protein WDA15_00460 [Trueperaceae bacterium]
MSSASDGLTAASQPVAPAGLAAAETGAVLARLPATALRAHGPDAATFLHGQLANDVTGLPVGGVNRSLSLNHRGHAMAEASVLRRAKDDLLLVVHDAGGDLVEESLRSHIIFDQVTLERLPAQALLTVQGPVAAELLGAAPEAGSFAVTEVAGAQVTVWPHRRSAAGGYDLLVAEADEAAVVAALTAAGAQVVPAASIDALRVRAGLPTAGGEGGEGVLPQEAALEGGLSYRKGCYLGQEIMARIEARGNLRRSLTRLELAALPQPGSERAITHGGRTVGLLGTVVQIGSDGGGQPVVEALAVLRNDLPADAELEAGGVSVARRVSPP